MKTILLLISPQFASPAMQTGFDAADFTAKFKKLFESAKTYFKNEKSGTGVAISDGPFVKQYDGVTRFNGATVSRMVEDGDGVNQHQVHYTVADKAAAVALVAQIQKIVLANIPSTFKEGTTYDARYHDMQAIFYEYNSDVFAEVAKRPSVKLGAIEKDGKYVVEVLILEAVFQR
jgi:hypothetical protein